MNIQPGTGYGFTSSAYGFTLDTQGPFLPDDGEGINNHPFRIYSAGQATVGGTPEYYFYCIPGTVNNLDPLGQDIGGTAEKLNDTTRPKMKWDFDATTHYSYAVLNVGVHLADPTIYPETDDNNAQYPLVAAYDLQPTSDNDVGVIILASAYKDPTTNAITIWQYVTGSLWTDRIKLAGIDAKYYFARI